MFLAFCCILFFVVALGLLSIKRIKDFNMLSADINDNILQNTRILAIIDNDTSDYHLAESSHILSSDTAEIIEREKKLNKLETTILHAQSRYNKIQHSAIEAEIYAQYSARWDEYRSIVSHVLELSRTNHKSEASILYFNASQSAFNAATKAIDSLISINASNAQEANNSVSSTYRESFMLIGAALLITVLMIAIVFQYIRHSVLIPMLDLSENMCTLAGNNTDIGIKNTERRDEVGEMARSVVVFRNNSIDLMLSQQKLTLQAAMLENMLEDERRLTALQRNFVSMASHEFRTPLTIIDGHAQRMIKMKNRLEPDDIVQRAGKIRGAVLQMTNLIKNLLNSSHLLDGDAEIDFHQDKIDLAILLRDVCHFQQEIVPETEILEEFDSQPLMIIGNSKLLFLVFSNILSNAIKYSPSGGPIKISAGNEYGRIVICVQDQGIGIPVKDLDRLFERYYRGSNVSSISGTGVGLYLVKIMVEQHGGDIAVESREGEGTRIIVHLPIE